MSKPTQELLACSACGNRQPFTCWASVNVTQDPGLKKDLLEGRLTYFTCQRCGHQAKVSYNLLFHDMQEKLLVWLRFPDESGSIEIEQEAKEAWRATAPGYTCRVVTNADELMEKILISDARFDDRAIEVFKVLVCSTQGIDLEEPLYFKEMKRSLFGRRRLVLLHIQPDGEFTDRVFEMDQFAPAEDLARRYLPPPDESDEQWLLMDRSHALRKLDEGGALRRVEGC